MTRDAIGALPPDAIAQAEMQLIALEAPNRHITVNGALGIGTLEGEKWALLPWDAWLRLRAAVLPQEAGTPRVQQAGEEVSPVTMSGDLSVASGSLRGSDAASPVAPSRAPSEAAPRAGAPADSDVSWLRRYRTVVRGVRISPSPERILAVTVDSGDALRAALQALDADTEHTGWRSWENAVAVVEAARALLSRPAEEAPEPPELNSTKLAQDIGAQIDWMLADLEAEYSGEQLRAPAAGKWIAWKLLAPNGEPHAVALLSLLRLVVAARSPQPRPEPLAKMVEALIRRVIDKYRHTELAEMVEHETWELERLGVRAGASGGPEGEVPDKGGEPRSSRKAGPPLDETRNSATADSAAGPSRAGEERPSGPWIAQPSNSTQPWRVWAPKRKVLSDLSRAEALAVRDALNRVAAGTEGSREP